MQKNTVYFPYSAPQDAGGICGGGKDDTPRGTTVIPCLRRCAYGAGCSTRWSVRGGTSSSLPRSIGRPGGFESKPSLSHEFTAGGGARRVGGGCASRKRLLGDGGATPDRPEPLGIFSLRWGVLRARSWRLRRGDIRAGSGK